MTVIYFLSKETYLKNVVKRYSTRARSCSYVLREFIRFLGQVHAMIGVVRVLIIDIGAMLSKMFETSPNN